MSIEVDGVNGVIKSTTSDADITIKGNDGGSEISALTFDMSDAGKATFNNDIVLGDTQKAIFGAGEDLQIFHDGTNSYIKDEGTGDLKITTNGTAISLQKGTSETLAYFATDSGFNLYHDNVERIGTTAAATVLNETGADIDFRIESNDNSFMFFVNGGSNKIGIGAAPTDKTGVGGLEITVGTNDPNLVLTTTDADENAGPNLTMYRNSSSPADGDILGQVDFEGRNDNSQDVVYARIRAVAEDVSDGTEDARLIMEKVVAGTTTEVMRSVGSETVFNDGSIDLDFRVESNGNTHALFVDAGNDRVGIGTSSPSTLLELAAGTLQIRGTAGAGVNGTTITCSDSTTQVDLSKGGTSSHSLMRFANTNGFIGSISTSSTSTAFNTSSDYRLKENVNYDWDGTTELKKLKPAKFNFKTDASKTLDGFLAHEVSSIVPIAVSGDKDGVDENGDPEYQGIDQSKLVPLMVKTIQELETRIKTLEDA